MCVSDIQFASMDLQFEFDDCIERFRTLRMYGLKCRDVDLNHVAALHASWDALVLVRTYDAVTRICCGSLLSQDSKKRDASLVLVKRKFTNITLKQTAAFQQKVGT